MSKKKIRDLTGNPGHKVAPSRRSAEQGREFLGTRQQGIRGVREYNKPLTDMIARKTERERREHEIRYLPIVMRAIAEDVCSKPVGKWTAKDMSDLEKYFSPGTVREFQEISDKRFKAK